MIEHIIVQMEEECGMDRASAIADMRFAYIEDVCKNTVVKPRESKERIRSQKIDKLLTGKYTGIPMFIAIMGLVFYLTFNVIGAALSNVLDILITFVTNGVDNLLTDARYNMGNSLMIVCAKLGLHFTACTAKEYFPNEDLVNQCREWAKESGGSVTLTEDVTEGTKGAEVLCTFGLCVYPELSRESIHLQLRQQMLAPESVTPSAGLRRFPANFISKIALY